MSKLLILPCREWPHMHELRCGDPHAGRRSGASPPCAAVGHPLLKFRSIRIYPSQLPITLASLENAVANVAGMVRENVRLRRAFFLPRPTGGVVASYLHQGAGEGLGRIAALVVLAPRDPGTELAGPAAEAAADLARKLGMQVVASAPRFLDREGVDPVAVEEERQVLRSQALGSGTLGAERFSRGWGSGVVSAGGAVWRLCVHAMS